MRPLSSLLFLLAPSAAAQTLPVLLPAPPVPYTGPGVVEVVKLHDADGDGLNDLVSRIDFPLQIMVQLNLGDAGFAAPVHSGTHSEDAFGTAFGHLDGDGVLDAVVGNLYLDGLNISVLTGDGAGGFVHQMSLNNGSSAFPLVAIGDVDGNGHGDIVSNTFVALSTLLGQPGGTFLPPLLTASAGTVGDPVLGDLDLDGDLDVVQVSDSLDADQANSTLRVSLGDGRGGFDNVQTQNLGVRARRTELVQRNADGDPDLLVYGLAGTKTGPGGFFLFENNGGTLQLVLSESQDQLGFLTEDVAGGDLNGDGATELSVVRRGSSGGADEVRVNDGDGSFPVEVAFTGPVSGTDGLVGELTGDHLNELVIVEIPIGPTETWFLWKNETPVPPPWTDLGQGLAGSLGIPVLAGSGTLTPGSTAQLDVTDAAASAPLWIVAGVSQLGLPLLGGTLVPFPNVVLGGATDGSGAWELSFPWPAGAVSGVSLVFQAWIQDAGAPFGYAATNALLGTSP